jgi:hypothetical protein
MRKGKFRLRQPKDVVRSAPKVTHTKSGSGVAKSVPKSTHANRIKNLGKFAHPAKLPTGGKIGANVKLRKSKRILKNERRY